MNSNNLKRQRERKQWYSAANKSNKNVNRKPVVRSINNARQDVENTVLKMRSEIKTFTNEHGNMFASDGSTCPVLPVVEALYKYLQGAHAFISYNPAHVEAWDDPDNPDPRLPTSIDEQLAKMTKTPVRKIVESRLKLNDSQNDPPVDRRVRGTWFKEKRTAAIAVLRKSLDVAPATDEKGRAIFHRDPAKLVAVKTTMLLVNTFYTMCLRLPDVEHAYSNMLPKWRGWIGALAKTIRQLEPRLILHYYEPLPADTPQFEMPAMLKPLQPPPLATKPQPRPPVDDIIDEDVQEIINMKLEVPRDGPRSTTPSLFNRPTIYTNTMEEYPDPPEKTRRGRK